MNGRIIKFAVIGSIGFIVDLLIFMLCAYVFNLSPYQSRVIAFICALACTWFGNRYYTFTDLKSSSYAREGFKFTLSAGISVIPNFAMFHIVLNVLGKDFYQGALALTAGVLAGAITNYFLSSRWVFIKSS
ncbi:MULTISPECIES: GtrA family protein [unclassified Psychromonas]|uniref:GtrA family protein n=1 Tax=unclassified Psychromonas TaxID=2614957 RepID=UPI0004700018|nr:MULTISPECIES: GtrA family protein [unclassified Psychromonas]